MKTNKEKRLPDVKTDTVVRFVGDIAVSVAIVLGAATLVYAVLGAWPPVVMPEGGSMEPGIETGSVIFVSGPSGLVTDASKGHRGVITHEQGKNMGYRTFGDYGDVVIYRPKGDNGRSIIHRAMFYVKEGETYEIGGLTKVAPHDGFVTKGDSNSYYDQERGISVVKPEWVEGKAEYEIPGDVGTKLTSVLSSSGGSGAWLRIGEGVV